MSGAQYPWSSGQPLTAEALDAAFNTLYNYYNNLSNAVANAQSSSAGSTGPVGITVNWGGATVVANGTYVIELYAPFQFTIASANYGVGINNGSFTFTIRNAGVGIPGLTNIPVSSGVIQSATATSGNVVLVGNTLDIVISNVSGTPNDSVIQINGTRSGTAVGAIPVASATTLGGVIVGSGLQVSSSGLLSTTNAGYVLPTASPTVLGGIQVGTGFTQNGNILNVTPTPTGSGSQLGLLQVGAGLNVSGGIFNVAYGSTANTAVQGNDSRIVNAVSSVSPSFTGTPTAPTAGVGNNSTQIATTAFVQGQGFLSSVPTATSTTLGLVKPDGITLTNNLGALSVTYGTTANTAVQGNDSRFATFAPIASPVFTGNPQSVTPPVNDNDTSIATTAFVTTAVNNSVTSVAGNTGTVTLAQLETAGLAPLNSPVFTGTPQSVTPVGTDNSTNIATTAYVTAKIAGATAGVSTVLGNAGAVTLAELTAGGVAPIANPTFTGTVTIPAGASISGFAPIANPTFTGTVTIPSGASISGFAPIANPTFTGTPNAPTPASTVNNNQIATTAYVTSAVAASTTGVSSVLGNTGAVTLAELVTGNVAVTNAANTFAGNQTFTNNAVFNGTGTFNSTTSFAGVATFTAIPVLPVGIANYAPLASPTFSGVPLAPTATAGNNTQQIATTAFVTSAVAASTTGVSSVIGNTGAVTLAELVSGGVAAVGTANTFTANQTFSGTTTTAGNATFSTTSAFNGIATFNAVPVLPAGIVNYAPINSPTFTGSPVVPGYLTSTTAASTYAPIASPVFTGTADFTGGAVKAGTATLGDNSTTVATTAFVQAAINNSVTGTLLTATGTAGVMHLDTSANASIDSTYPFPSVIAPPVLSAIYPYLAPRSLTITGVYVGVPQLTGTNSVTFEFYANGTAVPGLTSIAVLGTTGTALYTPTNPISLVSAEEVYFQITATSGTIASDAMVFVQYVGNYA